MTVPAADQIRSHVAFIYDRAPNLDLTRALAQSAGDPPTARHAEPSAEGDVAATRGIGSAVTTPRSTGYLYDPSRSFVAPRTGGTAGAAARNADELLANGRQVRGNFPNSASPNEVLYRAGPDGSVTYYQVCDDLGRPVMRVDLVGQVHGGIPAPHVQEYVLNTNPATGQTFVNKGPVRAALPEEIPS